MYVSGVVRELTAERQKQKLSLREVADKSGCSKSSLHDWEHGVKCPSFNHALSWANALGFYIDLRKVV